jgi:hypothetical protein
MSKPALGILVGGGLGILDGLSPIEVRMEPHSTAARLLPTMQANSR